MQEKALSSDPKPATDLNPDIKNTKYVKFYLIESGDLQVILNDLFSGKMRVDKSVELILPLFCHILSQNNAWEILNKDSKCSFGALKVYIENVIKQRPPRIDDSNINEIELKTGLCLEKYLNNCKIPQSVSQVLLMDVMLKNETFRLEFGNFIEIVSSTRGKKSKQVYLKFRNIIKNKLEKIVRISTSLNSLAHLDKEDLVNNLRMLFKCNFLKKIVSFIQIKEAVDVIRNKWFKDL